jgi:O-antigen ligase
LRAFAEQATTEMLSAENQVTQADLNRFWRSYEAYRGLQVVQAGTPAQAVLGRGLGARLDLGLYQLLDGEYRRHIPVLHNGFLYVVLKTGLAGLLAYLAWIVCIGRDGWRTARRGGGEARLVGVLVVGIALVLLEASLVIGGAFNFQACFVQFVVIGAAARWTGLVRAQGLARSPGC